MKKLFVVLAMGLMAIAGSSHAGVKKCQVELINGRNMLVDTFTGYGYTKQQACQEAKLDCRHAKYSGYYRARILTCQKKLQMVTRSCEVSLIGGRGRLIQSFWAQAYGEVGTGVKGDACYKAKQKCQNFKMRAGRYGATCVKENQFGGPVYRPLPMPRNPRGPVYTPNKPGKPGKPGKPSKPGRGGRH